MLTPGFKIGHAIDDQLLSGVTVLLPDEPATASCHVMGGAPGTRETDLLAPEQLVQRVDAIVLSGGSAFGLDAASGVQAWLRERQRGFIVGDHRIPIVPAAILFDLNNGGDKDWGRYPPYRDLGYQACESARPDSPEGSIGAGLGATTVRARGGLGIATQRMADGIEVTAVAVCNAVGSVFVGDTDHFRAAPFEQDAEFGGRGLPDPLPANASDIVTKGAGNALMNTTLVVLLTNASLDSAECKRMAINAHDGFARAIYPVHTPTDGDIVFALSSNLIKLENTAVKSMHLYTIAANCVTRAIARGVYKANL